MGLMSKFDKSLIVFFAIVFGLIFVGANVANFASNPSLPSHPLEQIDVPSICNAGEFLKINDSGDGWECAIINTTPQDSVPSGTIVMWSGTIDSIPTGWKLCDGSNGTPDLSGKFIVGYDSSNIDYNSVGKTGGLEEVTLSIDELPSHTHTMTGSTASAGPHTHTGTTSSNGNHSHSYSRRTGSTTRTGSSNLQVSATSLERVNTGSAGAHTHAINATINSTGGGQAHENRPPYYTIAFIMKE